MIAVTLASGIGLGASSCALFLSFHWLDRSGVMVMVLEIAFLIATLFAAVLLAGSQRLTEQPTKDFGKVGYLVLAGLAGSVLVSALTFAYFTQALPYGMWDAWNMFTLKARFMLAGGEHWRDAFSVVLWSTHPDYPLLVSGAVARLWYLSDGIDVWAPRVVAAIYTYATVLLLFGALWRLRGIVIGAMAAALLAATPAFIEFGSGQLADVPLSFFILSTILLLFLCDDGHGSPACMWLAGVTAGLATWTKNEGFLFVLVILFVRTPVLKYYGWTKGIRGLLFFLSGLLPVLLVVEIFKLQLAPVNDLLAGQAWGDTTSRILDVQRYLTIAREFGVEIVTFGQWLVSPIPLFLVYALIARMNSSVTRFAFLAAWLSLALVLAGYAFVYLVTPADLSWHLRTSLQRLLIQLWPAFLFVYFATVASPGHLDSTSPEA